MVQYTKTTFIFTCNAITRQHLWRKWNKPQSCQAVKPLLSILEGPLWWLASETKSLWGSTAKTAVREQRMQTDRTSEHHYAALISCHSIWKVGQSAKFSCNFPVTWSLTLLLNLLSLGRCPLQNCLCKVRLQMKTEVWDVCFYWQLYFQG